MSSIISSTKYEVVFGSGKSMIVKGEFLKAIFRDGNANIVSFTEVS